MRPRIGGQQLIVDRVRADEDVVRAVTEDAGGERRAHEGKQEQEDDEDPAADRQAIASQPEPDLLPVTAGANGLAELRPRLDDDRRA